MTAHALVPWVLVVLMLSWSVAGIMHAWSKYKLGKYWENRDQEDTEDGGGDKPITPYDIDPQFDPSDWWKHEPKERVR